MCGVERGDYPVNARREHVPMVTELGGEPVTRPVGRGTPDGFPQRGVLSDQPGGARPGRQSVDGLDECRADHDTDRVAGPSGPAGGLQVGDKLDDGGQCKQCCGPDERHAQVILWRWPWGAVPWSGPRSVDALAGAPVFKLQVHSTGRV